MRPNPLIVRAFLYRGALSWLVTRAMLSVVFLLAGINPVRLSAMTAVEIILLSVVVIFLDTYRRRERAFIANLAIGPLMLGTLFVAPAVLGEVALRFGAAALP